MLVAALLLGVGLAVAIAFAVDQRRRLNALAELLEDAAVPLMRSGAPVAAMMLVKPWRRYRILMEGGDHRLGLDGGQGLCPGQTDSTLESLYVHFPGVPNAAQIAAAFAAPPPPAVYRYIQCSGDCVKVMTHVWHAWSLYQYFPRGNCVLNVYTRAQFKCLAPGDPDATRKPVAGHPHDPEPPPEF